MDSRGLRVTKNTYFSLLTRTNHFLLVIFCDPTIEIGSVMKHDLMGHGRFGQYARIDVIVEVLMQILKTK